MASSLRPGAKFAKILWLIVTVFLLTVWVAQRTNMNKSSVHFFKPEFFTAAPVVRQFSDKYYLVNTEGCRIQAMDPFDASIQEYLVNKSKISETSPDERPIKCSPSDLPPLVSSNLTHIFINKYSVTSHNLTDLDCCYQPFWREKFQDITSKVGQIDGRFVESKECTQFNTSAFMAENEFVMIKCTANNSSDVIYKDFHSFTPIIRNKNGPYQNDKTKASVLIVGVDAVSRLNLQRQMPKTVDYLKNTLGAVEMLGYNKVGDNTFPNLVPVLTGLSEEELMGKCWPKTNSYFDNCPFLWKNFSEAGYRTCFAEDASWMGIFNYVKSGFFKQPTDYYWGVYNRRMENEIGFDKRLNAKLCSGYRMTLTTLLDYAKKFIFTMSNELSFGLFWGASISHDYLNLPMYSDDLHKNFLVELHDKGIFNNSILVFMSDHGIRWGGIRSTYLGYLEERLPFLYLVFPRWFKKKYTTALGNLRMNRQKLTTPFDLHETLSDMLHLEKLEVTSLKSRNEKNDGSKNGISLFLPIPANRTCTDARIPENWCTCHQATEISTGNESVIFAAKHLVTYINKMIVHEQQCAQLTLKKILTARVEQTVHARNESFISESTFWLKDYIITIETHPGNGHFEATIRRNATQLFETVGVVSRTNTYGSQSKCIRNYKLKLYCYCIANDIFEEQNEPII